MVALAESRLVLYIMAVANPQSTRYREMGLAATQRYGYNSRSPEHTPAARNAGNPILISAVRLWTAKPVAIPGVFHCAFGV